ncbi:MAG: response regulator [Campylobacterota bacterium]|nr:response regulator [Campylobacterota bacterium]
MKIIIVENELYLAQSISAKMNENGFETDIYSSINEALHSEGDVYLLSTTMPGQNCSPLISRFKSKIIILMVSYINNDTVSEPLKQGAKDYIVKPFMIEELLRKIEHYREYQELRQQNHLFAEYTQNLLKDITLDVNIEKINTPTVILTNYPRLVDKVAFSYAETHRRLLSFIPLTNKGWKEKIASAVPGSLLYIADMQVLKKSDREILIDLIRKSDFILSTTSDVETPFETIELRTESKLYDQNEILTIDDYVKFIVNSFQYKFPDTELSKKLGISRKSLWEKRKKYGIFKKK